MKILSLVIASLVALQAPALAAKPTIAVVGKAIGGEYWLSVKRGAERQAKKSGVTLLYMGTATESDVNGQIALVENLIQRKVDGLAVAPISAKALGPVLQKASKAGIKLVTVDTDTEDKTRLAYIGTNNYQAGKLAGQEMKKILGGKGTVAVVTGVMGAKNLQERVEGFKDALKGSGIKVLPEQYDRGDRSKAVAIAENTMLAHPELTAFFTTTAIGGPAVGHALLVARKHGKIKLVSFDDTPALLRLLKKGAVQALTTQKPERMGELSVETLLKATRGEKIPALIDTGVGILR